MSAAVYGSRSYRYSFSEKREIFEYVDKINAERGKGGQAAAARHFNVSRLTIAYWRCGESCGGAAAGPAATKLAQLQELHQRIANLERNLRQWRTEFDILKASL